MQKIILTGKEAREKIYIGVKKVSDAVVSTLGPRGRNAIISRCFPSEQGMQYYMPFVSRDGITVARNITLTDQLENTGANLIKQASEKTMSDCGDGTTTSCLLMRAILEEGIKLIDAGANPQQLKKEIDIAVSYVVGELNKMAVPINNDIEKLRQVATVSANNDSVIGDLIAEAFSKIGMTGDIDIEEAKGVTTEIKVADGFKFNRGWLSPYFITNPSKQEAELINPYILLYDKKITLLAQVENILHLTMAESRPLLIICDDADGEALAALAMNTSAKKIQCCIVRSPEFGDLKREGMEDLAVITGAVYISDEKGKDIKKATLKDCGKAAKVIVGKDETVIISGEGNKEELEDLLNNLKMNLVGKEGKEKEQIERRIAKLTGSVAVLYVGAATEVEMKEKKDRVDDAIRATKAAIAEGVVPGGGTAFLRIKSGNSVIDNAISMPLKQICYNAGITDKKWWQFWRSKNVFDIVKSSVGNIGYNAKSEKIQDLIQTGIIDPVKVLRCSLENAASAATMILISETLICDVL